MDNVDLGNTQIVGAVRVTIDITNAFSTGQTAKRRFAQDQSVPLPIGKSSRGSAASAVRRPLQRITVRTRIAAA
ncbi:MAG: hypothetical protein FIA97_04325 [Methylococcaceae bacterium]|nr:hypothetical protein [Methylococcaceae bacterium]